VTQGLWHPWRLTAWALAFSALMPVPAAAQAREPVGGVVADLRVHTVSLPSSAGWTPPALTTNTLVPSRGFGAEAGAHVVFGPGRHRRLGLGATGLFGQGRTTGTDGAPTVTTRLTLIAPHVSANFGHRLGWSYLSGGAGLAKVSSEAAGGAGDPGGWGTVFHYGGGARWFLNERVAVTFDLRFWALTPRAAVGDRPRAAANTRIVFGAGLSLR
jgi:hypothetical protein